MANRPGDDAKGEPWSNRQDPLDAIEKAAAAEAYAKAIGERVDKVWSEVQGLRGDLASFREEMAAHKGSVSVKDNYDTRDFSTINTRFQSHEDRIRDNERYRWMFPISAVGSLVSAVAAIVVALIAAF